MNNRPPRRRALGFARRGVSIASMLMLAPPVMTPALAFDIPTNVPDLSLS